eukprot:COSAG05_NODE_13567_length_425_cov_0.791411_1_plen_28_part_01
MLSVPAREPAERASREIRLYGEHMLSHA